MAFGTKGLKDGLPTSYLNVGSLVADSISGLEVIVGPGEIGTTELADNAVTSDKLAVSYNMGHFTLGTNGANVYVGFSGAGAAVTMGGSPLSIVTTMIDTGDEGNEPVVVVDYSTSGFNASGNVANTCMYLAFEEG